ncbi:MAG: hypothetical protein MUC92_04310 [Fimbriimonadaceae bacterium]|jgi:hypothetical protein|nr:hypothetical protein [Fimbriimonadaceae bacterium]
MVSATLALLTPGQQDLATAPIVGASLFKNGYAVVTRRIAIPSTGELVMRSPLSSVLGTVWLGTQKGTVLTDVRASTTDISGTRPANSLNEILQANVGKEVTILALLGSERTEIFGKVIRVSDSNLLIETSDNFLTLPNSAILTVSGDKGEFKNSLSTTEKAAVWRVKGTPGGTVFITGLVRGLTWVPSYQIDISNDKKLTLTSKATLINDLEDMDLPEARLITGFPNLPFINISDPFDSGVNMNQFLNALSNTGAAFASPAMPGGPMTQNAAMRRGEMSDISVTPFEPNELEGFRSEDLFFYRQPKVNLKRGERGYYVLFQADSEYEHIYTVRSTTPESFIQPRGGPVMSQPSIDVWHELKFKNTSKMPFTTAGAITVKDGEILGQDMLGYVSPGADTTLKITKALDIQAEEIESEFARRPSDIKDQNGNVLYDIVTIRGTWEIINRKGREVKMEITKSLPGEAKFATNAGVITIGVRRMGQVNLPSSIKWTLPVPSGKPFRISYEYEMLIRVR